jgi:hypothetical protein
MAPKESAHYKALHSIALTYPAAGVIATSPATAPLQKLTIENLPR